LHRRYGADAAFPGKAAGFLRRLAVRYANGHAERWTALHEFHRESGLHIAMLDEQRTLERKEMLEQLKTRHYRLQIRSRDFGSGTGGRLRALLLSALKVPEEVRT